VVGETVPARAWLGGALLGAVPMPRPVRYRFRLRHPDVARASDAIADRVLAVLLIAVVVLLVVGLRPGASPSTRLYGIGGAVGLLTGIPFVVERRQLRRRLRALPPLPDPLDELSRALPYEPGVHLLQQGDAGEALAAAAERDRDDVVALRVGAMACALLGDQKGARARALRALQVDATQWEIAAQTGLALARRGRFGEGVRLLERGAEVSNEHHRAELMHAHGLYLAGRLRDAAEVMDRAAGRGGSTARG
jgi:tetratricopeptide (TPR) repeat protein